MTDRVSAGNFAATFSSCGYPCLIDLTFDGKYMVRISHKELADLEYVVARCRELVKGNMEERHKHEV